MAISIEDALKSPGLLTAKAVVRLHGLLCLTEGTEFARMYSRFGGDKYLEPSIIVELRNAAFFQRHWRLGLPMGGGTQYAHECVIEGELDDYAGSLMIRPRWIEFGSTPARIVAPITQCPPTIPSQPGDFLLLMSCEAGQRFGIAAALCVDIKSGASVLMPEFSDSWPSEPFVSVQRRFRANFLLSSDDAMYLESGHVVLRVLCMGVVTKPFGDDLNKAEVDVHSIAFPWGGAYRVIFPRED